MTMLAAANAGSGGKPLTNQTVDEARFNLTMAWADVAMAGIEVGLETKAIQRLAGKLTGALATARLNRQQWKAGLEAARNGSGPLDEFVGSLTNLTPQARADLRDTLLATRAEELRRTPLLGPDGRIIRRPDPNAEAGMVRIPGGGKGNSAQKLEAKGIPKAQAQAIAGKNFGVQDLDTLVRSGVAPKDAARLLAQGIDKAELDKLVAKGHANPLGTWVFNDAKDLDWRGGQHTFRQALDEAYSRTGVPKKYFKPSKWSYDAYGKSHPSELEVPRDPSIPRKYWGAQINVDWGVLGEKGAMGPHVGYQGPGKATKGGNRTGHILLDSVPYNRPPIGVER
jgi:hypothetical protein